MRIFRKKIDRLLDRAAELGRRDVTMPIDIFSLARAFADLPDKANTIEVTRPLLSAHENAFVRRVFFTMIRFMDIDTRRCDLDATLLAGLKDASLWVRYDAAWIITNRPVSTPAIVSALQELAAAADSDESDAVALKKQATEALASLSNSTGAP